MCIINLRKSVGGEDRGIQLCEFNEVTLKLNNVKSNEKKKL